MSKSEKFHGYLNQQTLLRSADVMITELEACRIWCEENKPNANILNRMYHMTCVLENIEALVWEEFKYSRQLEEYQEYVYVMSKKVLEELPNIL